MESQKVMAFLAVAETLSFTAAAKNLHKNQSVLSRQIAGLENDIGIQLFDRSTREVILTPAGRFLKDRLSDHVLNYTALLDEALAIQSGYDGSITICTLAGRVIGDSLAPLIRAFEMQYPKIRVMLYAKLMSDMRHMLGESQTDFVFARRIDFDFRGKVQSIDVSTVQNCLVVPAYHPLALRDASNLSFSDLEDETFLVLSDKETTSLKRTIEQLCEESGITPRFQIAPDMNTILFWLELGRGISAINSSHVSRHNPRLKFLQLPQMGSSTESIIWNKDNVTSCGSVFIDFVNAYVAGT